MENSQSHIIYNLFWGIVIAAGLAFTALFVQNIWIQRTVDFQKAFGYILFFSAVNAGLISEKQKVRHLVLGGLVAAAGALLIII